MGKCHRSGPYFLSEDCFSNILGLFGLGWFQAGGSGGWGDSLLRQGRDGRTTHLPCGLDALPDAEEADQPDQEEAESKVPL